MASTTIYSHDLRLLVCSNCGAPLEAQVAGGIVRCQYCQASHHVGRRDERRDLQEARQASRFRSEVERVQHLRTQDHKPRLLPGELSPLVRQGRIVDGAQEEANRRWLAWRQQVQAGANITVEERFFHLTLLLARTYDGRRSRAVLEDAVELCHDPRHRHILRCEVARDAARAGDPVAARDWLRVCTERADELEMDSAFRIASAHLTIAERKLGEVAVILGAEGGDMPIHDAYDAEASLLRGHASELAGDVTSAASQLEIDMLREPRLIEAMQEVVNRDTGASLCPRAFPLAFDNAWRNVKSALLPPPAPSLWPVILLWMPVLLGSAIITLAITGAFGSHPAIVVNAIVHPLIWLVLLPLIFALLLSSRRKAAKALRDRGIYTYARVGSSGAPVSPTGSMVTLPTANVFVEILLDDRVLPTAASTSLMSGPVAPGCYPCFVDPSRPETVRLQLTSLAPVPFRQAFS